MKISFKLLLQRQRNYYNLSSFSSFFVYLEIFSSKKISKYKCRTKLYRNKKPDTSLQLLTYVYFHYYPYYCSRNFLKILSSLSARHTPPISHRSMLPCIYLCLRVFFHDCSTRLTEQRAKNDRNNRQ